MFGKKYVFETKSTRTKRFIFNSMIVSALVCVVLFITCLYLPFYAYDQNEITEKAFFKKAPDLISAYTGDGGRLEYTFLEANKYPSSKILVSGVYAKSSLETLLQKQGLKISAEDYLNQESHHIELDYLARNTVENVLSTIRYLGKYEGLKSILIVSSDYHIFRIKLIVDSLKNENSDYEFNYYGIKSDYTKPRNIKILFKEVYKLIKTSIFLLFWN